MRILALLILALPTIAWASDGDRQLAGHVLPYQSFKPTAISNLPMEVESLEYPAHEPPRAHVSDLNGDGEPDYLIAAHESVCGTGGCPYLLVDGKSRRTIGEFFGAMALLRRNINGYPVIQTASKRDLASVTVSIYVFDAGHYQLVASALLEERGIADWEASLKAPRATP